MSMAGVAAYRPDRSRAKLIFQTKPGSYNTESLIEFLKQLRRHLRGKPVVLIWDGLSAHRSKAMKAWLASQQHWLTVEALPGYAHDLNPMEMLLSQCERCRSRCASGSASSFVWCVG
jgi:transposase